MAAGADAGSHWRTSQRRRTPAAIQRSSALLDIEDGDEELAEDEAAAYTGIATKRGLEVGLPSISDKQKQRQLFHF
jgi:hypothetical protein